MANLTSNKNFIYLWVSQILSQLTINIMMSKTTDFVIGVLQNMLARIMFYIALLCIIVFILYSMFGKRKKQVD